jgi:hypothetical protein
VKKKKDHKESNFRALACATAAPPCSLTFLNLDSMKPRTVEFFLFFPFFFKFGWRGEERAAFKFLKLLSEKKKKKSFDKKKKMPSLSSGKKKGRTPRASSTRKRRRASLVPELSVLPANSKEPVSARSAPQARGVSMLVG